MKLCPATLVALALAGAAHAAAPEPRTIGGFANPESVLVAEGRRFVSNLGAVLDPTAHDGDGFIAEVDAAGTVVNSHAFPPAGETLDAPKGMTVLGDRLYVADIDRVVGFDLASGARVFEAVLPAKGPVLANDLVADEGGLVVSDTLGGAVWRLDPASGRFARVPGDVPGANGLAVDGAGRLVAVGVGEGFRGGTIFAADAAGTLAPLPAGPRGLFDGVAVLGDGSLLVSDWVAIDRPVAGRLRHLAADGHDLGDVGPGITGPADFAIDGDGALWVPSMPTGNVVIVPRE